jgi:phage-related protein (TIGR01555 family)
MAVETVKPRKKKRISNTILGQAIAATRTLDAFSNPGARTGYGEMNLLNTTEYPLTRLTQNWSLLTSLYRCSWIVQRICSVLPEDAMTDLWIEYPKIDNDKKTALDFCLRKTRVRRKIIEAIKWARLYGGSAAIIMVEGQEENMAEPLKIDDIMPGSFRGLFVVDRWSGIYPSGELVSNPRSMDYGLPLYYEVRDELGAVKYRVHHSRVIRFIGCEMPYYEAIAEQQWGTSVIESVYDNLIAHDNVVQNVANLTFKACLSVYEIENLDQKFASSSSAIQRQFYAMIQAQSILESNLGIRLINKGDTINQLQYSFSGLPEVMDMFMLEMAGASSIPATRLFGRAPAGMNSTGESDEKFYRSTLEQQRSSHIIPALEKLCPIICKSAIGAVPVGSEFKLPPLQEINPQEKYQIVDTGAQVLERLFAANVIPADALLNGIRNAQTDVGIITSIPDEVVEQMKGKYARDMDKQGDPFGGIFPQDNTQAPPPSTGETERQEEGISENEHA